MFINYNNTIKMSLSNVFKDCNKQLQNAYSYLKTGVFHFRFEPDYLKAELEFRKAAAMFKKFRFYEGRITALEEAAKCNHELHNFNSEGTHYKELIDIELELLASDDENERKLFSVEKLNSFTMNACIARIKVGDNITSVKVYNDVIKTLRELPNQTELLISYINLGYSENIERLDDKCVRVLFNELMYMLIDIMCELHKQNEIIDKVSKYVENLVLYKKEVNNGHRICCFYTYLAILHLLNNEEYLIDDIKIKMFAVFDEKCSDEIRELESIFNCYLDLDDKKLTYCINSIMVVYPNGLVKRFKDKYNERLKCKGKDNVVDTRTAKKKELDNKINEFKKKFDIEHLDVDKNGNIVDKNKKNQALDEFGAEDYL